MPDETKVPEQENQPGSNQDYIDAITKLKENSVDKKDYEKLQEENKRLLQSLIEGGKKDSPKPSAGEVDKSIDELRKKLKKDENMTNLEFTQAALKLRQQVLERDGKDIFVAAGKKYNPTKDDYESAQRVADIFQECVDEAEGDPSIFTNAITRRLRGQ